MAFTVRSFLLRLALALAIVFFFALLSRAGGPKYIAGTSYFESTASGQPLVWPLGQITYYTDQGDLSPILPNASANSLVADAFSQWTSVPTAALTATSGGQLAMDRAGSDGRHPVTLSLSQLAGLVEVSACVAPSNSPCQNFYANPVPLSQLQLQLVAGAGQISEAQGFQPVVVRVTDSASPPDPVLGAAVVFQTTVLRPQGTSSTGGSGETNPTNPAMPVILSVSQTTVTADINGLASITPSSAGFSGPLEVDVAVTAGTSAALDYPLELLPAPIGGDASGSKLRPIGRPAAAIPRPPEPP